MKPPFVKRAYIYLWQDIALLNPVSRAVNGGGFGLPVVKQTQIDNGEQIGKFLLDVLAASIDDMPDTDDRRASLDVILGIAKVKTWASFMQKARLVVAHLRDDKVIELTPTAYLGARHGSDHLDRRKIKVKADSPIEIGKAVLAAAAKCK